MKKILLLLFLIALQNTYGQSDCSTSIGLCGTTNISYTPDGPGNIRETLGGCMTSNERKTAWYTFTAATSGTLTFVITPNSFADYDWALYGPNVTCDTRGIPIRCSYAAPGQTGITGLDMTSTDTSEGGTGDGFVRYLDVQAGETYILVVDNYTGNTSGFGLVWGGTATLASPFNDTNIAPNPFLEPGQNANGDVYLCNPTQAFDFTSLNTSILNGNPNYGIKYYRTANDLAAEVNPISTPIVVTLNNTYYYAIQYLDPANPNSSLTSCRRTGSITFKDGSISMPNAELFACSNYTSNVGTFDLTQANHGIVPPNVIVKYYPTVTDANQETNEIPLSQASAYTSASGNVYIKYTNEYGCHHISTLKLSFHPKITTTEDTLTSCFIPDNVTNGIFDLTTANLTTIANASIKYYTSLNDAINNTNEITTPNAYTSPITSVYARITDENGCWNISKINLRVKAPTYSSVLKDKIICIENKADLDAGAGFDTYLWSTGATTQKIFDVGVGEYWVDLTTNGCVTRQIVYVKAAVSPVISNIEITNNSATISVTGGVAPYEYSIDGIEWQSSNVLNNLERGEVKIFVRDSYNCAPIVTTITVPNLVNAITPNDDGVNDYLDYSALRYKKNLKFVVFDRQGNKLHQADESNFYIWDGRSSNKKLPTGNYWYAITWEEKDGTPMHYTGWILVKNQ